MATTNEPNVLDEDVALLVPGRDVGGLDLPVPGLEVVVAGIVYQEFSKVWYETKKSIMASHDSFPIRAWTQR
jgi:hypothetical protein